MESLLVLIGYLWAIAGVIWLLDNIGDGDKYFKREDK